MKWDYVEVGCVLQYVLHCTNEEPNRAAHSDALSHLPTLPVQLPAQASGHPSAEPQAEMLLMPASDGSVCLQVGGVACVGGWAHRSGRGTPCMQHHNLAISARKRHSCVCCTCTRTACPWWPDAGAPCCLPPLTCARGVPVPLPTAAAGGAVVAGRGVKCRPPGVQPLHLFPCLVGRSRTRSQRNARGVSTTLWCPAEPCCQAGRFPVPLAGHTSPCSSRNGWLPVPPFPPVPSRPLPSPSLNAPALLLE